MSQAAPSAVKYILKYIHSDKNNYVNFYLKLKWFLIVKDF
jgi:hypothetical protein